jgi:methenyltetrahydrofolate cyclohydrolase
MLTALQLRAAHCIIGDMHRSEPPGTLRSLPAEELLAAFARGTPAPGGGSATALAGAMAGALAAMVASISLGKSLNPDHRDELQNLQAEASGLQTRLAELIDEDATAYLDLLAAYGLPGDTSEALASRSTAVATALQKATETPLAIAGACVCVLELAARAAVVARRSASADAAVAALLASAALRGAALNVKVNLRGVRDEAFRNTALGRVNELLVMDQALLAEALQAVELGG